MTKHEWKRLMLLRVSKKTCVCYLCGELIKKHNDLTLEHVLPQSRFHIDDEQNWKPSHAKCNAEKGALTADEYVIWKRLNNIRTGVVR